ncbi:MAG: hypothetical protein ACFCUR_03105 [Rhodomicrobiaceae bacterium]
MRIPWHWMMVTAAAVLVLSLYLSELWSGHTEPHRRNTPRLVYAGYDLVEDAGNAVWSNDTRVLTIGARGSGGGGMVTRPEYELLEDRRIWPKFLLTQPQQAPYGAVQGRYGPFTMSRRINLLLEIGYTFDARPTASGRFKVFFLQRNGRREPLHDSVESYDGCLARYIVSLESVSGRIGYLLLQVAGGSTAWQDKAVWARARVIPADDDVEKERRCGP